MTSKSNRIMWLLNHREARKFETSMLKKIGINEIYLPKKFPPLEFRSINVDYSEDEFLTIPKKDLDILNDINWYEDVPQYAWDIANQYFDYIFFVAYSPDYFRDIKNFKGASIWRTYGLAHSHSYSKVFAQQVHVENIIKSIGHRFWFGQAYDHLHKVEPLYLQKRSVFLPLGLIPGEINDLWIGNNRKIFFICPCIGLYGYYGEVYKEFKRNFNDLPYICGGTQPVSVNDEKVIGFVSNENHEKNMRELRVMYYHSTEPNHIHYHPFEAIRIGMPLLFMSGGMLDKMGGIGLPGRCCSIKEARYKLKRILNDDWQLIKEIRASQSLLLQSMKPVNCEVHWRLGFEKIKNELKKARNNPILKSNKKRIAVILPIKYGGGSFQGAKLLAKALLLGAHQSGRDVDIVFAHIDDTHLYSDSQFYDLPNSIKRRKFKWKILDPVMAKNVMIFSGNLDWQPNNTSYMIPDDGIETFLDCDLWVIISDRLMHPLLPIRPNILMIYDYLQRYVSIMPDDQNLLDAARAAEYVMVTTKFTHDDAIQYAGIHKNKVYQVPMLIPPSEENYSPNSKVLKPYFIWTTNSAPHKNHINSFDALKIYYEKLGGILKCHITGVNTKLLLGSKLLHLKELDKIIQTSSNLRRNIKFYGDLDKRTYLLKLSQANFLWHPCRIDNGTFSVIEAAHYQIPSLSSDYPAMHEINNTLNLNLRWMNPDNPEQMAEQLLWMQANHEQQARLLPSQVELGSFSIEHNAHKYWEVIEKCL